MQFPECSPGNWPEPFERGTHQSEKVTLSSVDIKMNMTEWFVVVLCGPVLTPSHRTSVSPAARQADTPETDCSDTCHSGYVGRG